jgi:hypothetical protein
LWEKEVGFGVGERVEIMGGGKLKEFVVMRYGITYIIGQKVELYS